MKELFDRLLTGAGLGELADWLNRQGVQTPSGRKWTPGSVKVVLRNPRYAGIRGMRPWSTGRRTEWFEEIAPGQWQEIVSEDKWRAAVARLASSMLPGLAGRTEPTPRHLLSGLPSAGSVARTSSAARPARPEPLAHIPVLIQRYLVCRADHIEQFVQHLVIRRLSRPDAVDLLIKPADKLGLHAAQIDISDRAHPAAAISACSYR